MSTSSDQNGESPTPKPTSEQVTFLLGTMADTTWRMFIPIVGLTLLGVWLDRSINTKPWATLLGIVVGTLIAGLLVKRQLQKAKR